MRFASRPLALTLLLSLVACSGGGASAPGGASPGTPAKPQGKPATLGVSIHIPATVAGSSTSVQRVAAGSRIGPKFVSPSSNGLSVVVYTDMTHASEVNEVDFDISSATGGCTQDANGGRTCSVSLTETAGVQDDYVISTYASTPSSSSSGFGSAPSLDSVDAGLYTLSSTAPTTIAATLGGTVTAVKLSVPQSFQPYAAAAIPVGVTALDAAGDIIISSAPYSSPITLGVSTSGGATVFLSVNGGGESTQVTSTKSSDIIALAYPGDTPANAGEVVSISASSTVGASAAATTAPLYVTGAPTQAIVTNQAVLEVSPTSGTQDTIALTEGKTYTGPLTIVPDPKSSCTSSGSANASATSPLLFSATAGGAKSTTPPALSATNGAASLYVTTAGYTTPGNGCIYDVADASGASVPFTISAVSYVACPGNSLYVNYDSPGPQGGAGLEKFALPLTANSVPTQLEGAQQNVWLSFDPSCNAYLSSYNGAVTQYASPYTSASGFSYAGASQGDPYAAAADGNGRLFVDESSLQYNAVQVVQMSTGTVTNTLSVPSPYSLAFDSKANLYVGGSQGIYEFAPPYTQTSLVQSFLKNKTVQGIAFDASDTLFAVGNNSLTVLTPPYGTTNVIATNTDSSFSTPLGLAVDANGNVYVPNYGANTITEFVSPYTGAPTVTLPVSGALPDADAIGP